jgi:HPt (histidine-containing phosphotransfer) domain-containing protein
MSADAATPPPIVESESSEPSPQSPRSREDARARIADLVGDGGAEAAELVGRLVASFLERAPGLVDQLADAIDAGDAQGAIRKAHALTGVAGNIGASEVARMAADAELDARAGALDRLTACRADLEAALVRARADLTAALAEHAATTTA